METLGLPLSAFLPTHHDSSPWSSSYEEDPFSTVAGATAAGGDVCPRPPEGGRRLSAKAPATPLVPKQECELPLEPSSAPIPPQPGLGQAGSLAPGQRVPPPRAAGEGRQQSAERPGAVHYRNRGGAAQPAAAAGDASGHTPEQAITAAGERGDELAEPSKGTKGRRAAHVAPAAQPGRQRGQARVAEGGGHDEGRAEAGTKKGRRGRAAALGHGAVPALRPSLQGIDSPVLPSPSRAPDRPPGSPPGGTPLRHTSPAPEHLPPSSGVPPHAPQLRPEGSGAEDPGGLVVHQGAPDEETPVGSGAEAAPAALVHQGSGAEAPAAPGQNQGSAAGTSKKSSAQHEATARKSVPVGSGADGQPLRASAEETGSDGVARQDARVLVGRTRKRDKGRRLPRGRPKTKRKRLGLVWPPNAEDCAQEGTPAGETPEVQPSPDSPASPQDQAEAQADAQAEAGAGLRAEAEAEAEVEGDDEREDEGGAAFAPSPQVWPAEGAHPRPVPLSTADTPDWHQSQQSLDSPPSMQTPVPIPTLPAVAAPKARGRRRHIPAVTAEFFPLTSTVTREPSVRPEADRAAAGAWAASPTARHALRLGLYEGSDSDCDSGSGSGSPRSPAVHGTGEALGIGALSGAAAASAERAEAGPGVDAAGEGRAGAGAEGGPRTGAGAAAGGCGARDRRKGKRGAPVRASSEPPANDDFDDAPSDIPQWLREYKQKAQGLSEATTKPLSTTKSKSRAKKARHLESGAPQLVPAGGSGGNASYRAHTHGVHPMAPEAPLQAHPSLEGQVPRTQEGQSQHEQGGATPYSLEGQHQHTQEGQGRRAWDAQKEQVQEGWTPHGHQGHAQHLQRGAPWDVQEGRSEHSQAGRTLHTQQGQGQGHHSQSRPEKVGPAVHHTQGEAGAIGGGWGVQNAARPRLRLPQLERQQPCARVRQGPVLPRLQPQCQDAGQGLPSRPQRHGHEQQLMQQPQRQRLAEAEVEQGWAGPGEGPADGPQQREQAQQHCAEPQQGTNTHRWHAPPVQRTLLGQHAAQQLAQAPQQVSHAPWAHHGDKQGTLQGQPGLTSGPLPPPAGSGLPWAPQTPVPAGEEPAPAVGGFAGAGTRGGEVSVPPGPVGAPAGTIAGPAAAAKGAVLLHIPWGLASPGTSPQSATSGRTHPLGAASPASPLSAPPGTAAPFATPGMAPPHGNPGVAPGASSRSMAPPYANPGVSAPLCSAASGLPAPSAARHHPASAAANLLGLSESAGVLSLAGVPLPATASVLSAQRTELMLRVPPPPGLASPASSPGVGPLSPTLNPASGVPTLSSPLSVAPPPKPSAAGASLPSAASGAPAGLGAAIRARGRGGGGRAPPGGSLTLAGKQQQTEANRVLELFQSLGLSADELGAFLQDAQGQGLTVRVSEVENNMRRLFEAGLSDAAIRSVGRASPHVFLWPQAGFQGVLDQLAACGVDPQKMGNMLVASSIFLPSAAPDGPACFSTEVPAQVGARLQFLRALVPANSMKVVLEQCPEVLGAPLEVLQANAAALSAAVGADEVGRALELNPAMLECTELATTVLNFLFQSCELTQAQVRHILQRRTFIRGTSGRYLEARLRELLEVADRVALPKILVREPAILSARIQTMVYNKARLREMLEGDGEMRAFVVKFPRILRYNWNVKVAPTLDYFARECGLARRDVLWAGVCAYSLEKAIKPRIQFLLSRNLRVLANSKSKPAGSAEVRAQTVCLSSVIMLSHRCFTERFASLGYVDHKKDLPRGKKAAKAARAAREKEAEEAEESEPEERDWEEVDEGGAEGAF